MNLTHLNVEKFLLHRDRMKLIDDIIDIDDQMAVSESIVSSEWPLFDNGYVHPIVIIELVAQTAGINIKWNETDENKSKEGVGGVMVGVKKAVFHIQQIPEHSTLRTCSKKEFSHLNYAEFSGLVTIDEKKVGEVIIQLFRTD